MLRAKEKRKEKAKNMPNITPSEEVAHVGPRKANVRLKVRAHSSMNLRHRPPSPTGSPHRISKNDGKGSDDGGAKGTRQFIGESFS